MAAEETKKTREGIIDQVCRDVLAVFDKFKDFFFVVKSHFAFAIHRGVLYTI